MAEDRKLQIDDDWKNQAAEEKEQLAREVEDPSPRSLPQADFTGLVNLLAMQVVVGLGGMAGHDGRRIPPNLELAKHHIDLLDVLDGKTAGHLDPDEKKLLDTTLHQLRMAYVEAASGGPPGAGPSQ
ncbi:MAG: DUF1844 domain-containing protein [Phycisphaerae bacterium]